MNASVSPNSEAQTRREAPVRLRALMVYEDKPAYLRARLALEELKSQGGFDRSTLIVVTPTS